MANPTNEEFINRIMQAESGGRRYDKNGKLLEGPKTRNQGTGKGEMQVVDKTNLDPGFGVTPAKNKSPDERARVGKDYAQAMLDRYDNDRQVAAMAYNWGPGNVDKWVAGGKKGAIPEETANYVVRVTGSPIAQQVAKKASPFDTAAAPAPAVAAGAAKAPAPAPVVRKAEAPTQDMKARIAALGPSYHAAMALAYLADNTDEDDPTIQAYRERTEDDAAQTAFLSEPVASPAIADLDLKVRSPFPEPVAAARGGLIHRADGSPEEGEGSPEYSFMGVPRPDNEHKLYPKTERMNSVVKAVKSGVDTFNRFIDSGPSVGSVVGNVVGAIPFVGPDLRKSMEESTVTLPTRYTRSPTNPNVAVGVETSKVPVTDALNSVKMSDLVGGTGVSNVLGSVGKGYAPSPLDVLDTVGAGAVGYKAAKAGVKTAKKASDMLRELKVPAQVAADIEPALDAATPAAASLSAMATQKGATATPFFSPLDAYAQTLTGPVTPAEFIKQVQNKGFRAYDVERAKEAMQKLGTGQVSRAQILDSLDETYHPESFITKVAEPGTVGYTFPEVDNVFNGRYPSDPALSWTTANGSGKSPPQGVVSLHLPVTDQMREARQVQISLENLRSFKLSLINPSVTSNSVMTSAEKAASLIADVHGQRSEAALDAMESVDLIRRKQEQIVPYLEQIPEYLKLQQEFKYPMAKADAKLFLQKYEQEGKILSQQYPNLSGTERAQMITKNTVAKLRDETRKKLMVFFEKHNVLNHEVKTMFKDAVDADQAIGEGKGFYAGQETYADLAFRQADNVINRDLKDFHTATGSEFARLKHQLPDYLVPNLGHGDLYSSKLPEGEGYTHMMLHHSHETNPVAFSRFTDHTVDFNGQKMEGMYVSELQSDLYKQLKQRGAVGKSAVDDAPRLVKLREEEKAIRAELEEARNKRATFGANSDEWFKETNELAKIRARLSDTQNSITKIREKVYDVSPAFAGMENSPQVVQQLAAKNAVIAGIKRGKNFVAFPGVESDQAKLYKKMPRNIDEILRDLGPGFEHQIVRLPLPEGVDSTKMYNMMKAKSVEYPMDANGIVMNNQPLTMLSHAIVWSPEAAARILKQGVRFNHGGSVERQPDDNRRYL